MNKIVKDLLSLATPVDDLKSLDRNPRKGDVDLVMKSYEQFGQRKPIVALADGTIIAGNHQYQAARRLGWDEIAVVRVDDDESKARAYAVADNKTGLVGEWDLDVLLESLGELDPDLLAATGFSTSDVDDLVAEIEERDMPKKAGLLDEGTNHKKDSDYKELLERYMEKSTRAMLFEFESDLFEWLTGHLQVVREEMSLNTNAEAFIHLVAEYRGVDVPESKNV
jgi:hypothetical protein